MSISTDRKNVRTDRQTDKQTDRDTTDIIIQIGNTVRERPVDNSHNFDGVAYIAQEIIHLCCLPSNF